MDAIRGIFTPSRSSGSGVGDNEHPKIQADVIGEEPINLVDEEAEHEAALSEAQVVSEFLEVLVRATSTLAEKLMRMRVRGGS